MSYAIALTYTTVAWASVSFFFVCTSISIRVYNYKANNHMRGTPQRNILSKLSKRYN